MKICIQIIASPSYPLHGRASQNWYYVLQMCWSAPLNQFFRKYVKTYFEIYFFKYMPIYARRAPQGSGRFASTIFTIFCSHKSCNRTILQHLDHQKYIAKFSCFVNMSKHVVTMTLLSAWLPAPMKSSWMLRQEPKVPQCSLQAY